MKQRASSIPSARPKSQLPSSLSHKVSSPASGIKRPSASGLQSNVGDKIRGVHNGSTTLPNGHVTGGEQRSGSQDTRLGPSRQQANSTAIPLPGDRRAHSAERLAGHRIQQVALPKKSGVSKTSNASDATTKNGSMLEKFKLFGSGNKGRKAGGAASGQQNEGFQQRIQPPTSGGHGYRHDRNSGSSSKTSLTESDATTDRDQGGGIPSSSSGYQSDLTSNTSNHSRGGSSGPAPVSHSNHTSPKFNRNSDARRTAGGKLPAPGTYGGTRRDSGGSQLPHSRSISQDRSNSGPSLMQQPASKLKTKQDLLQNPRSVSAGPITPSNDRRATGGGTNRGNNIPGAKVNLATATTTTAGNNTPHLQPQQYSSSHAAMRNYPQTTTAHNNIVPVGVCVPTVSNKQSQQQTVAHSSHHSQSQHPQTSSSHAPAPHTGTHSISYNNTAGTSHHSQLRKPGTPVMSETHGSKRSTMTTAHQSEHTVKAVKQIQPSRVTSSLERPARIAAAPTSIAQPQARNLDSHPGSAFEKMSPAPAHGQKSTNSRLNDLSQTTCNTNRTIDRNANMGEMEKDASDMKPAGANEIRLRDQKQKGLPSGVPAFNHGGHSAQKTLMVAPMVVRQPEVDVREMKIVNTVPPNTPTTHHGHLDSKPGRPSGSGMRITPEKNLNNRDSPDKIMGSSSFDNSLSSMSIGTASDLSAMSSVRSSAISSSGVSDISDGCGGGGSSDNPYETSSPVSTTSASGLSSVSGFSASGPNDYDHAFDNGTSGKRETTFDVNPNENISQAVDDRCGNEAADNEECGDVLHEIKPMGPLSSRHAHNSRRSNGNGAKSYSHSNNIVTGGGGSGGRSVTPKGYLDSLSSLRAGSSSSPSSRPPPPGAESGETDASGYMSDRDVLKTNRNDDKSGYMSEGGAGAGGGPAGGASSAYHNILARQSRLQQKLQEGLKAARTQNLPKSSRILEDDSIDECSSVSSSEDISDEHLEDDIDGGGGVDPQHQHQQVSGPPSITTPSQSYTRIYDYDSSPGANGPSSIRPDSELLKRKASGASLTPSNSAGEQFAQIPGKMRDYDVGLNTNVYSSSTLERARRKNFSNDPSAQEPNFSPDPGYRSNTLGRLRSNAGSDIIGAGYGANFSLVNGAGAAAIPPPSPMFSTPILSRPGALPLSLASEPNSPWIGGGPRNDGRRAFTSLSEAESIESLRGGGSSTNSVKSHIEHARASAKLTKELLSQQQQQQSRDLTAVNPGHNDTHASYSPSSIGDSTSGGPTGGVNGYLSITNLMSLAKCGMKQDDTNGSTLSLSSSSSIYSSTEEKQNAEIKRLRRELEAAQEKVTTLSSQLNTNAHVVSAFEQSLANMTARLQKLSSSAEQKDSELHELRVTIESIRKQSGNININPHSLGGLDEDEITVKLQRRLSTDSMSSLSSACSEKSGCGDNDGQGGGSRSGGKKKSKGWIRSSLSKAFTREKGSKKPHHQQNRHGSVSDMEGEGGSVFSSFPTSPIPSSSSSATPSAVHVGHYHHHNQSHHLDLPSSHDHDHRRVHYSASCSEYGDDGDETVDLLKKQLEEKERKLTDVQLEALSSAHYLEQLRETVTRMRDEMSSLKADNDKLQKMISTSKSLNSSESFSSHGSNMSGGSSSGGGAGAEGADGSADSITRRLSLDNPANLDFVCPESPDRESRKTLVTVCERPNGEFNRVNDNKPFEVCIGAIGVTGSIKWDVLDSMVRRAFKEYIYRIDPMTNLGLTAESILHYTIGPEIIRPSPPSSSSGDKTSSDSSSEPPSVPEMLPCAYLVDESLQIKLTMKGVKESSIDMLSFETLIPKTILNRYISLLLDHRRVIFCGPSGTGKSYIAHKLAEYVVMRSGRELSPSTIATFNVDQSGSGSSSSSSELHEYLSNLAAQCETVDPSQLPVVIILDNLHQVSSLSDVFNGFLRCKYTKCPYIIGTMNQATGSSTNLQLHHNFRWVLLANHLEPVKGFLGRYLRRKYVEMESLDNRRNLDLNKVLEWLPRLWQHANKFLELHNCAEVTLGPRPFMQCPIDLTASQVWFTDLWNHMLLPYMLAAAKEGLQSYGRRAPFEDPTEWVLDTYPWHDTPSKDERYSLQRLRPVDVGYDTITISSPTTEAKSYRKLQKDPLYEMLTRLQETDGSYS